MPVPLGAAIIAASGLASSGVNAIAQGKTNRATRKWNEKMYGRQRADALADWERENAYNHPTEQMNRLRAAGLNPNLVYGNGATTEAGAVRGTEAKSWNPNAPQFDLASVAHNALTGGAQVDNLREQNKLIQQETALKAAQTAGTIVSTFGNTISNKRSEFQFGQDQQLAPISLEAAKANLEKTYADTGAVTVGTDIALARNEREAALNASSIAEAAARILHMRNQDTLIPHQKREIDARIESLKKDADLKQLDIDLRKMGVNPHDPIYWRALGRLVSGDKAQDIRTWLGERAGKSGDALNSDVFPGESLPAKKKRR